MRNSNTIIVGDFNTPLSTMDRSSTQGINKETVDMNNAVDQLNLRDIYRIFYPITAEYTLLSACGTFFRIEHMLGHKTSLSKFKNIEIIPSIFSDHNGMKLEISNRKKTRKFTNTWKLNNTLLTHQRRNERGNNVSWDRWKMEILHTKTYGMHQKQF